MGNLRGFAVGILACTAMASAVDFGPNVLVFRPSMPAAEIQKQIDAVYAVQQKNQFGPARNALLFLPGSYRVDVPIGYYTQVIGLGASADAVKISGNVHSDAALPQNNATCNFWESVEGFSVEPSGGTMRWAVSQASPFRRMHVRGDLVLHQNRGWASGGWMSDVLVDGNVDSGTQQQWISRNTEWRSWTGSNWNMVFVGVNHPPAGEWPNPPYTKIPETPVVREKPFLQVDAAGKYSVRVPALRRQSAGITWREGATPGTTIPLSRFYIVRAGVDTAATINAQLSRGKNLLFPPGIYDLEDALRVTRPDTVVLGLGFATLRPVNGTAALAVADVDGVTIAGLLFDAGAKNSPVLVEVGREGSTARHAENPIALHDVFFRVGGAGEGRASVSLRINSNDTIVDHTWIWRADHGEGVGWNRNPAANGLVVNGNSVTIYGLFVEHYQQYQVLWNGNGGRVYFYQSEIPYDPPDQASYTSAPGVNGWASYKVADQVTDHEAWGLGIYSVFLHPGVVLSHAIEVPTRPEVKFHDMITVRLGNLGEILNVINNTGGATADTPRVTPKVTLYPDPTAESQPTFSLTIRAKDTVKSGSPIIVTSVVTNVSGRTCPFLFFREADYSYAFHVLEAGGNPVPLTEAGRVILKGELYPVRNGVQKLHMFGAGSVREHILKPGESRTQELDVNRLFDMSRPGTYTIYVQRGPGAPVGGATGPIVQSNTITVTVTP